MGWGKGKGRYTVAQDDGEEGVTAKDDVVSQPAAGLLLGHVRHGDEGGT